MALRFICHGLILTVKDSRYELGGLRGEILAGGGFVSSYVCDVCRAAATGVYFVSSLGKWVDGGCRKAVKTANRPTAAESSPGTVFLRCGKVAFVVSEVSGMWQLRLIPRCRMDHWKF